MTRQTPITILMAEDDPDDRFLAQDAWTEARLVNDFRFVTDGEELLHYLQRKGQYADPTSSPLPGLILLDLNMPRMNGIEALKVMKQDPKLRRIPVVVLTTSKAHEDVVRTYDLGVSGYITKPVNFERLVYIMSVLGKYWFQIVELPTN